MICLEIKAVRDIAIQFISCLKDYKSNYSVSMTYTKKHIGLGIDYKQLYEFVEKNNFSASVNVVISDNKLELIEI